jgi:hypothetical protein
MRRERRPSSSDLPSSSPMRLFWIPLFRAAAPHRRRPHSRSVTPALWFSSRQLSRKHLIGPLIGERRRVVEFEAKVSTPPTRIVPLVRQSSARRASRIGTTENREPSTLQEGVPFGTLQRCGESKAEAICKAVDAFYAALGFLGAERVNDDERGVSSENIRLRERGR